MSGLLWKYFLEDDVERFQQLLEGADTPGRSRAQRKIPSTDTLGERGAGPINGFVQGTSPLSSPRSRDPIEKGYAHAQDISSLAKTVALSRADLNKRDDKGLTILHYAVSSITYTANAFALALVSHPYVDLYVTDLENGWTALHRAFYFGNVSLAQAIIERDAQDIIEQRSTGLIKAKDREGLGPYDLLAATIKDRTLRHQKLGPQVNDTDSASDEEEDTRLRSGNSEEYNSHCLASPKVDVHGDELFAFGSNRNFSLGIEDEDYHQFPERVLLERPTHLYQRFFTEKVETDISEYGRASSAYSERLRKKLAFERSLDQIPNVVRSKPITIQNAQMSRFHTAVLTNDPISNMYVCGHGLGGRLGTGDQATQFRFVCLESFGGERKKIIDVAVGQDHTLCVTSQGEVFSWGSNHHGALGQGMPKTNARQEDFTHPVPKQIFGTLKREIIIGVAASRIHSVAYSINALFTFGANEGQLGITDSHAGTIKFQATPRQVAASRFSSNIRSVSAIERATICLLESNEVHVLANYGAVKLQFPLDGFENYFLQNSFRATKYLKDENHIVKLTGGGDTVCALSSAGEVFTVLIDQVIDPNTSSTVSTTHPKKIRAAISQPARAWSLKKDDMAARDVDVDQDGSIILSTEAGSVWRRVRRTKGSVSEARTRAQKAKDFKFMRVPNLTRAIAVRASGSGGYMALRQECDVTRSQIVVNQPSLERDLIRLLPLKELLRTSDEDLANPPPAFWRRPDEMVRMRARLRQCADLDAEVIAATRDLPNDEHDIVLTTSSSDIEIPVHGFIAAGRSPVFRLALQEYRRTGTFLNEIFCIKPGDACKFYFPDVDILVLVDLVLYLYTDSFADLWPHAQNPTKHDYRFRRTMNDLTRVASRLELPNLETAVKRRISQAEPSLEMDMELAFHDSAFLDHGDVVVQLSNGQIRVHSRLVSNRCPFFEGLFRGRSGGQWLAHRRVMGTVKVDLSHVEIQTFRLVLQHLYADTGEELFDDIVTESLEDFQDLVIDVLAVANELMLNRLSRICQSVIGRYGGNMIRTEMATMLTSTVNVRNACSLLNAIAPSSVTEFKDACLEYLCLNLEPVLFNHFLDELDYDLLHELNEVVRANQMDYMRVVRSGVIDANLLQRHPKLPTLIQRSRQARIDAVNLHIKDLDYHEFGTSLGRSPEDGMPMSVQNRRRNHPQSGTRAQELPSPTSEKKQKDLAHEPSSFGSSLFRRQSPDTTSSPQSVLTVESPSARLKGKSRMEEDVGHDDTRSSCQPAPDDSGSSVPEDAYPRKESYNSTDRPWGSTGLPMGKLNMKQIMEQASSSKTSSLSLGLRSEVKAQEKKIGSFGMKISQKERKRQQQNIEQLDNTSKRPSQPPVAPTSASPWNTVSKPTKPSGESPATTTTMPIKPENQSRATSTPQLTMRQTIANSPTPSKGFSRADTSAKPQQRSVSTPQNNQKPSAVGGNVSSDSQSTPVRSIRYQNSTEPAGSSQSLAYRSLADIISQEEAGKAAIKDAVAKRSLQEIQQEQEFQEWWDKESREVQEAARASSTKEKGRGNQRGKHQRRGKGKLHVRDDRNQDASSSR
ncbi:MAG: hypothetical protein M1831_003734 [Alyxoria varia]|nr:MAG: hypothetical protein M1831_003734 [Alyxoria varia]